MSTQAPMNIPSPESAFENKGTTSFEAPEQFNMGENPDGTFKTIGEAGSIGEWIPDDDPSVISHKDLQHAAAEVATSEAPNPDGEGFETLPGRELLEEYRSSIARFTGTGSERETMSRLSRFNPFRSKHERHSLKDVKESAERLDEVQEEVSVRLQETLQAKTKGDGSEYFDDDAITQALNVNKLFSTFTVARLRKEYLEDQAERASSRGILGRLTGFMVKKVVNIDQKVESGEIGKLSGSLRKIGYFGATALPLGIAGIAASPLLGLGAGAAMVGADAFAASRVGRGLFSAKVQNTADSINLAEKDQLQRIDQQEGEEGITSAFVEGGEAKVKETDKRLLKAMGITAAFGAAGYLAGSVAGNTLNDVFGSDKDHASGSNESARGSEESIKDSITGNGDEDSRTGSRESGVGDNETKKDVVDTERENDKDTLVDAKTGEKIRLGSLDVESGGGFISTFQDTYGLSDQQANDLYYNVESHLRGMEGTYSGSGDVRISAPGELELSKDAQRAIHDELIQMGVAEEHRPDVASDVGGPTDNNNTKGSPTEAAMTTDNNTEQGNSPVDSEVKDESGFPTTPVVGGAAGIAGLAAGGYGGYKLRSKTSAVALAHKAASRIREKIQSSPKAVGSEAERRYRQAQQDIQELEADGASPDVLIAAREEALRRFDEYRKLNNKSKSK